MGTRDSGQGAGRVKWTLTNVCSMAEHQSFHVTVNTPLCVSSVSYKESDSTSEHNTYHRLRTTWKVNYSFERQMSR